MTTGICDVCWGSGDATNHWYDLRKSMRRQADWENAQVETYLCRQLGIHRGRMAEHLMSVVEFCRRQSRRRVLPDGLNAYFWVREWENLAATFRKLVPTDDPSGDENSAT